MVEGGLSRTPSIRKAEGKRSGYLYCIRGVCGLENTMENVNSMQALCRQPQAKKMDLSAAQGPYAQEQILQQETGNVPWGTRAQATKSDILSSNPYSATYELCDFGQVT